MTTLVSRWHRIAAWSLVLLMFASLLAFPATPTNPAFAQDNDPPPVAADGLTNITGIASGDVTQTSAVLWASSAVTGTVEFGYSTDMAYSDVISLTATVTDTLVPVKVLVENLSPTFIYYYRVADPDGNTREGQFYTPAEEGYSGLRFGVSGDWRGELSPYPAVSNADERNLDFFVLHGDTIYADYPSPSLPISQAITLEDYRIKHAEAYGERRGLNTWGDVRAAMPVYATIDDHEVTNDFAGGALASSDDRFTETLGLINQTALFNNGLQAFQEWNPLVTEIYSGTGDPRLDGRRKLYRYRTFGKDAAIMVLDNRSFRDQQLPGVVDPTNVDEVDAFLQASFSPTRTMLGKPQLQDLLDDLQDAQDAGITWKFVLVPEPIQNLGVVGAADRFEGYAFERSTILDYINDNNITNVVFVAADIHGTVVNNLTYQDVISGPVGLQIPTGAFEISTGSVAFDAPFGPTIMELGAALGVVSPQLLAQYNAVDPVTKEVIITNLLNSIITPQGYDALGLQDSGIPAQLLEGGYTATSTYGWSEFEVSQNQTLLVTTYGIEAYTPTQILSDTSVLTRTPEVVSQFKVAPLSNTRIRDIQGGEHISPLSGTLVLGVPGIVTAVRSNGFYFQDPTPDANDDTSEGIFVFTGSNPGVAVGDDVRVSGSVSEFRPGGSETLSVTQIGSSAADVVILSSGNPLPAPITIGEGGRPYPTEFIYDFSDSGPVRVGEDSSFNATDNAIDFKESLEGMLVQVNDAAVIAATNGFGEIGIVPDNATGAVVRSINGGLLLGETDPNPEIIMIDDSIVFSEPQVNTGVTFTAPITGVMDYTFGYYKLFNAAPLPATTPSDFTPEAAPFPTPDQLRVATYNVLNLDPDDPQSKFDLLATHIITNLQEPDIVALQEIQDNDGPTDSGVVSADQTLQKLVDAITAAGGPAYAFFEIAPEDKVDGGQPGANIRVAYIYRTDRVQFNRRGNAGPRDAVQVETTPQGAQLSLNPGRIDPTNPAFFESRKPLAAEFTFNGNRVFVVNNHFNSKSGDNGLFGVPQPPILSSEVQRIQIAQVVNRFVRDLQAVDPDAPIIVLGDLNDFQWSPPLTTLAGSELTNLETTLPVSDVYSFIFNGNSQALDHILVNNDLVSASTANYVHVNLDIPASQAASDHDPVLVYVNLPPPALTLTATPPQLEVNTPLTFTVALSPSVPFSLIRIDPGDGSGNLLETGSLTATLPYSYTTPGAYVATATLLDVYNVPLISATTTVSVTSGVSQIALEVAEPAILAVTGTPNAPDEIRQSTPITVSVTQDGLPVANAPITLETTLGTLSVPTATTDANGLAVVTLTAGSQTGIATITASTSGASAAAEVPIVALNITAAPTSGQVGSETVFEVTTSYATPANTYIRLNPGDGTPRDQQPLVRVQRVGFEDVARFTYTYTQTSPAEGFPVHAYLYYQVDDPATLDRTDYTVRSDNFPYTVAAEGAPQISLQGAPLSLTAGTTQTAQITASVTTGGGLPLVGASVTLTITSKLGATFADGSTTVTGTADSAGVFVATLRAAQVPGTITIEGATAGAATTNLPVQSVAQPGESAIGNFDPQGTLQLDLGDGVNVQFTSGITDPEKLALLQTLSLFVRKADLPAATSAIQLAQSGTLTRTAEGELLVQAFEVTAVQTGTVLTNAQFTALISSVGASDSLRLSTTIPTASITGVGGLVPATRLRQAGTQDGSFVPMTDGNNVPTVTGTQATVSGIVSQTGLHAVTTQSQVRIYLPIIVSAAATNPSTQTLTLQR